MSEKITALVNQAVRSRNRQSNGDTWEIVLTIVAMGLVVAGAVVFQAEIHDWFMSFKGDQ